MYAPCHVLLMVRIKVKKTQYNSSYCELGPPVSYPFKKISIRSNGSSYPLKKIVSCSNGLSYLFKKISIRSTGLSYLFTKIVSHSNGLSYPFTKIRLPFERLTLSVQKNCQPSERFRAVPFKKIRQPFQLSVGKNKTVICVI